MRIIAGNFKAKRLNAPKEDNKGLRPTLDRVKESMFSIITPYIKSARVLDLFAGTGNLGLEAISRGASYAHLNDFKNDSISLILSNVTLTNTKKYVKITKKDYIRCLKQLTLLDETFDIIFIDPPYDTDYAKKSLEFISNSEDKILSKNGIIVYELDKYVIKNTKDIQLEYENLECTDERTYGRVVIRIYKWRN